MANFTTADIKRLRELTGAGMLDTKKALQETDGDFEKAAEQLRLKGAKAVDKRQGRATANGLVAAKLDGTASGVLLELNCETDFVAKNERFQRLGDELATLVAETTPVDLDELLASAIDGKQVQDYVAEASAALGEKLEVSRFANLGGSGRHVYLYQHRTDPDLPAQIGVLVELDADNAEVGKDVAHHIAAAAPRFLSRDEVPAHLVDEERSRAEQLVKDEGKPEHVAPRIVEGRLNAFYKNVVLGEQTFVKDDKKTVGAMLADTGVAVTRFARFRVGES